MFGGQRENTLLPGGPFPRYDAGKTGNQAMNQPEHELAKKLVQHLDHGVDRLGPGRRRRGSRNPASTTPAIWLQSRRWCSPWWAWAIGRSAPLATILPTST